MLFCAAGPGVRLCGQGWDGRLGCCPAGEQTWSMQHKLVLVWLLQDCCNSAPAAIVGVVHCTCKASNQGDCMHDCSAWCIMQTVWYLHAAHQHGSSNEWPYLFCLSDCPQAGPPSGRQAPTAPHHVAELPAYANAQSRAYEQLRTMVGNLHNWQLDQSRTKCIEPTCEVTLYKIVDVQGAGVRC